MEQRRVVDGLVAELGRADHLGLQHELDERLRALALHDDLARFVEGDVVVRLGAAEPGVGHVAELVAAADDLLERVGLGWGELRGVEGHRGRPPRAGRTAENYGRRTPGSNGAFSAAGLTVDPRPS